MLTEWFHILVIFVTVFGSILAILALVVYLEQWLISTQRSRTADPLEPRLTENPGTAPVAARGDEDSLTQSGAAPR